MRPTRDHAPEEYPTHPGIFSGPTRNLTEEVYFVELRNLKPLDRLARDFANYLAGDSALAEALGQRGTRLETTILNRVRALKVFRCTEPLWWELRRRSKKIGEDTDSYLLPPVQRDRIRRQRTRVTAESSEEKLRTALPARAAAYDAVILLYRPERRVQAWTRETHMNGANEAEFQEAQRDAIEVAAHRAVARECLHLLYELLGWEMPTWDPATDRDPSERYFIPFVCDKTPGHFRRRYLARSGGALADELDLDPPRPLYPVPAPRPRTP
jgi:hypothetical protein